MSLPQTSAWVLAGPEVESEAYLPATILEERTDGSLRVRTATHGERIVRLGHDAWPFEEQAAKEPADLCACNELHTVRPARMFFFPYTFIAHRSLSPALLLSLSATAGAAPRSPPPL